MDISTPSFFVTLQVIAVRINQTKAEPMSVSYRRPRIALSRRYMKNERVLIKTNYTEPY